MKKFAFAALAALAGVIASEQQAKAWFNFGIGGSANMNLSWGGMKLGCRESEPWPQQSFGNPGFNNYGPAGIAPYYPPSQLYNGWGSGYMPGGYMPGPSYIGPMPGYHQGSGSGSGSGTGYYYIPQSSGYAYGMPYADGLQQAYYQVPSYWYGR